VGGEREALKREATRGQSALAVEQRCARPTNPGGHRDDSVTGRHPRLEEWRRVAVTILCSAVADKPRTANYGQKSITPSLSLVGTMRNDGDVLQPLVGTHYRLVNIILETASPNWRGVLHSK
jgi:hypothetical protein